MTFALMVLAGSVGALARYEVGGWVQRRGGSSRPWGTASVNLTGALALGWFAGMTGADAFPGWAVALGFGFFGGYTTFSTWMVESLYIAREGRSGIAALFLNLAGLVAAGFAGLVIGLAAGGRW